MYCFIVWLSANVIDNFCWRYAIKKIYIYILYFAFFIIIVDTFFEIISTQGVKMKVKENKVFILICCRLYLATWIYQYYEKKNKKINQHDFQFNSVFSEWFDWKPKTFVLTSHTRRCGNRNCKTKVLKLNFVSQIKKINK